MPYIFSHKSPDNNSNCSARIAADWLYYRDQRAVPFRLGEINTHNILNHTANTTPALLEGSLADKARWRADFTDTQPGATWVRFLAGGTQPKTRSTSLVNRTDKKP
ncbi:hypothetical protein SJI19_06215 [Acerihabitans sp. TG2]|uniref:hypothetical protein n=1 Tax=Acerihabitans sp. TG2 TaxID=3096008 RepID=UPI002B236EA4|nr:hypothetical protein [Acerihabitans sp. TG2]MEA9390148.1 hypothetical protein [Acerihabitans sp. TG2]